MRNTLFHRLTLNTDLRRQLAAAALAAGVVLGGGAVAQDTQPEDLEAIPATLPAEVKAGPAAGWRFLSGPGVDGALRLSPEAIERVGAPIGHFVLNVTDRGFYQGVYNIREDGASIVGVFWPDGAAVEDPIAGVLDIGAAPTGDALGPSEARLTFLNGEMIGGAQAQ